MTNNEIKLSTGFSIVEHSAKLYYELRSPHDCKETRKVVMITDECTTLKHFDEQAEFSVKHFAHSPKPIEILTYNHRGIGKSLCASDDRQTSRKLANDALLLINDVWGTNERVHVYGMGLGGMVAQELAVLLVELERLCSLYLCVTSRGSYIRPKAVLMPGFWSLVTWARAKNDHKTMVRDFLLPALFLPSTLEAAREKYETLWTDEFDEWWAFGDKDACGRQACAVASHFLSDRRVQLIRNAGILITVQVSSTDKVISPAKQSELAKLLDAKTVIFDQNYTVDDKIKNDIFQAFIAHLEDEI